MRQIKFRAWEKEIKYMFTFKEFDNATGGLVEAGNNAIKESGSIIPGGLFIPTKDKNMVIMQYTGRKDKHGKEIYEGDVLKIPEWLHSNEQEKCICTFDQENQCFPITGFGLYTKDNYSGRYKELVESDEWDEFEVIGNIYKNPELLEE